MSAHTGERRTFAGPDRPAMHDLQNCIRCGFCLPHCPTYVATGEELESPRGRLQLIRGALEERVPANERLLGHLDLCLQCRACETACPSAVPYGRIMEDARASLLANPATRPRAWWLRARAVRLLVGHPRLRGALFGLARTADRARLVALARRVAPATLRRRLDALPLPAHRAYRRSGVLATPAGAPRGTVGLLLGCVHGDLDPETHAATVRVLRHLGYAVVAPPAQACCGALSRHAGDASFARDLARRNIDAFTAAGVETVVVNAAGCGAAMKEYGDWLRDDPRWAGPAERFASGVRDVLEFIAEHDFAPGLERAAPLDLDVTLQDACHLAHAQRIREAPRRILRALPGVRLHELRTPDRCCGAAGLYALAQPSMSARVLDAKIDDVASTGAGVVATSNVGCTLHLQRGLDARGAAAEATHVVRLLDRAYEAAGFYAGDS